MVRFFTRYQAVLVPLAAAALVAGGALPLFGPVLAFAAAAMVAGLIFAGLLLVRPARPVRPARAPLSVNELGLAMPGSAAMPAPDGQDAHAPAPEPALLEPGIDEALRRTLADLRRLARAA